jgi:hypothetical protein
MYVRKIFLKIAKDHFYPNCWCSYLYSLQYTHRRGSEENGGRKGQGKNIWIEVLLKSFSSYS